MRHSYCYRDAIADGDWHDLRYDLFIGTYNVTERAMFAFQRVEATEKVLVVHPQLGFTQQTAVPTPAYYAFGDEVDFCDGLLASLRPKFGNDLSGVRVCLDVSSMLTPELLHLLWRLPGVGVRSLDVLYTEPAIYERKNRTVFATGIVQEIRHVAGYGGIHDVSEPDFLLIGAGYETRLLDHVANFKSQSEKRLVFGLPAVFPEMFQESLIQVQRAKDILGGRKVLQDGVSVFAPANDPFMTAEVVEDSIDTFRRLRGASANVYLCPLGSRAQVLGFGLHYLYREVGHESSLIYPICSRYEQRTSVGIGRSWRYGVELPPGPFI